jgi:hypothetical protein
VLAERPVEHRSRRRAAHRPVQGEARRVGVRQGGRPLEVLLTEVEELDRVVAVELHQLGETAHGRAGCRREVVVQVAAEAGEQ